MEPVDPKLYPKKQHTLAHAFESLRVHLKRLYDNSKDDNPTLQYVVLLDLSELSLYNVVRAFLPIEKNVSNEKKTVPGYRIIDMDSKRGYPPIPRYDGSRQVIPNLKIPRLMKTL